jgi:hypothetical protein
MLKKSIEPKRDFGAFASYKESGDVYVLECVPCVPDPPKLTKLTRPNEYGRMLLNKRKRR